VVRIGLAIVALCAGLAVAACGSVAIRPAPPVRLSVERPTDRASTLAGAVAVRGTVSPAQATVLVAGRPATVHRGRFSARVSLVPGMNVIDIVAGASHATGATTALRLYREMPVTVPDVTGMDPARAAAQLTHSGLRVKVLDGGGFFESLIPTSKQVCGISPAPGRSLAPGSQVQVQVAKLC
jgi:beta-lactam-binding protein with PASTA domain